MGEIQSWEQMLESRSGFHPSPKSVPWLFYRDESREHISVLSFFHINCAQDPNDIALHNEVDFLVNGFSVRLPMTWSKTSYTLHSSLEILRRIVLNWCKRQNYLGVSKEEMHMPRSPTTTPESDAPGRSPQMGILFKLLKHLWSTALLEHH